MEPSPRGRAAAAGTLLVARAVYAFNWYNIGGVLPLIGERFAIGTVDRGIVLAAFLAGAAIFQLPAGYVAMRWGARRTTIAAIGAMGAFALASAASPTWEALALLRFGAGAGAAFFFSPALGLVTAYYPSGRRGFMIGAYNGAFSAGSAAGLFLSAVVGPSWGWAAPLGLGGGLLLAVAAVSVFSLPPTPSETRTRSADIGRVSTPVLRSRGLWAMALGGAGLWGGYYIAAQYFVNYAHQTHPAWSLAVAAAAPTGMIAVEIAAGPIGGWLGERSRDMRRALVAWGIVAGALLAAIPWLGLAAVLLGFAVLGFSAGVTFALLYLIPTYLPEAQGNRIALGLGLINFAQILLGSAIALGFAVVASSPGYPWAWAFAGAGAVAFLPALLWAPKVPPARGVGPGNA